MNNRPLPHHGGQTVVGYDLEDENLFSQGSFDNCINIKWTYYLPEKNLQV